ncbi:MAG TPA: UDP-N-acetylglucosamine--N-acetylmuramyl-(pentapeptide) pyrophosphoryl-undecaprenol N-acetylglucosamine transferase [Candidatus Limnocylindria bacterium]|nr:UDP-N-acetylglucosamine--N-acetylmuramyl-(pentapeptide) pyrophosphoryl-undecaprenol N-acetylglucosamine transferase [Candidatus Limnocylindria bacterium]
MRLLVSGGGTGGHVYPALAVARALHDARPELELSYVGGVRGFERRIVGDELPYDQLVVRSLRSAGRDLHLVLDPLRLGASIPQAWALLGRLRPSAVFSSGGYLGIPLVLAARGRGIPSLVWEGNVIPGRATRAVGRVATRVAVSFPPTLAAFPGKSFVSGTPIRSFAGVSRTDARASFGMAPDDRLLLVFGGSQAVARLTAALHAALPRIVGDWRVLHLAGEAGMPEAEAARRSLPEPMRVRYEPIAFLTDRMTDALVAADLVVGRAGSSTCAEVAGVGVASLLVPYPFAGAHQRANARWLADQGAAVLVPDAELDGERLLAELGVLRDDGVRAAMAEAARRLGRPDAAAAIAAELLAMAEGRPLPSEAAA